MVILGSVCAYSWGEMQSFFFFWSGSSKSTFLFCLPFQSPGRVSLLPDFMLLFVFSFALNKLVHTFSQGVDKFLKAFPLRLFPWLGAHIMLPLCSSLFVTPFFSKYPSLDEGINRHQMPSIKMGSYFYLRCKRREGDRIGNFKITWYIQNSQDFFFQGQKSINQITVNLRLGWQEGCL